MGGRVSKGDIFNLPGLSDDHLQSSIFLYNYGQQLTLLPSSIPITCGTAPLQHDGISADCDDLRTNLDQKKIFLFHVIKCFVKCNVSIKCNVRVK